MAFPEEHMQLISSYLPLFLQEFRAGNTTRAYKELIQTPWPLDETYGLLF